MLFFFKCDWIVILKKYFLWNINIIVYLVELFFLLLFLNSCIKYFFVFDVDKIKKIVFDNCFYCVILCNMFYIVDNRWCCKVVIGILYVVDVMYKKR